MTWKLWIDDQIEDPNTPARHIPDGFIGAASSYDAMILVKVKGLPAYIDFDHDLGGEDTSMKFLNKLVEMYPNGPVPEFQVHSQNPIGTRNIISFMNSWKKSLSLPDISLMEGTMEGPKNG